MEGWLETAGLGEAPDASLGLLGPSVRGPCTPDTPPPGWTGECAKAGKEIADGEVARAAEDKAHEMEVARAAEDEGMCRELPRMRPTKRSRPGSGRWQELPRMRPTKSPTYSRRCTAVRNTSRRYANAWQKHNRAPGSNILPTRRPLAVQLVTGRPASSRSPRRPAPAPAPARRGESRFRSA